MNILLGKEMLYTGLYYGQHEDSDNYLRKAKGMLVSNPQLLTHRKCILHIGERGS